MLRYLFAVFVLVASSSGLWGNAAEGRRPNVLMIMVDDLNDWVGCLQGHPDADTPHIDTLAGRGTLFSNAHCQSPICGPSRASLLSGRYPHETGLYNQPRGGKKGGRMVDDTVNFHGHLLPEYFAQHGYQTFGGGKITHGYPLDTAFQVTGPEGGAGPKPEGPKPPNDVRFNFTPDYSRPFTGTQTDWGVFPERDDQMPDYKTADWAVSQLSEIDTTEKPFLLVAGFHRPHVPFYVPERWFQRYPLDQITLPKVLKDDLSDVSLTGIRVHELPRYPQPEFLHANGDEQLRLVTQAYLACTTFVDAQVGKLTQALATSSHAQDTIIVLMSDHGYHLGEKGRVSKHSLWEESTRVPMIVVSPDGNRERAIDEPVGLIDIYPTLIDMCGLPEKEELSGHSLVPLMTGDDTEWRSSILCNYGRGNYSLRGKRYRYIQYDDGSAELYDHKNDPNEWRNLLNGESAADYSDVIERFQEQLPKASVPYHSAIGMSGAVNAWFEEHYEAQRE